MLLKNRKISLRDVREVWAAQLQTHMADAAQGGAGAAVQTPLAEPCPTHHALQSNLSGCPKSSVCLWTTSTPGLDSTSCTSERQASPNIRPLALPSASVPTWHPASPGLTPSVSFHHVVWPGILSLGANSNVPRAPAMPLAPVDGGPSAMAAPTDNNEVRQNAKARVNARDMRCSLGSSGRD